MPWKRPPADIEQLQKECVRLREAGLPFVEIAAELRISTSTASRLVSNDPRFPKQPSKKLGQRLHPVAPTGPTREQLLDRYLASPIGSGVPRELKEAF